MASVNVEITGDARKLEQTFTKIEGGQDKVEKGFSDVAATAKDSARQIEAANEAAATKGMGSYSRIVAELKRQGPEGRAQAKAIEEYLQAAGKAGRRSIGEIVEELKSIDQAAAAAAEQVTADMAAADQASQFTQAVRSLRGLGDIGKATAEALERELKGADEQTNFDKAMASLTALNPAAAEVAERVRAELKAADEESQFNASIRSLRALGDVGRATAEALERELSGADEQTNFDKAMASLTALNPAAAQVAERVRAELDAADRQASFEQTLAKLRSMGPAGRQAANEVKTHLVTAGELAEESIDDVVASIRQISPAAADAAASALRDFEEVGDKGQEAFGDGAVTSLKNFAMQWFAVSKAIDVVKSSIDAMKQAQQDAVASLQEQQPANQRLLQVTNTTEEFRAAQLNADRLAGTYGITREDARGLGFSAISSGFADQQDYIAQNAPILGIQSQAEVAGIATKTFADEGVRVDEAIEATLAAAAESVFNFEQLAAGLPKLATRAKEAGSGFDEMLGQLSAASDHFQSVDRAADRLGAFAAKLALDTGEETETDEAFSARVEAETLRARKAQIDHAKIQQDAIDAETALKSNAKPEAAPRLQTRLQEAQLRLETFDSTTTQVAPLQRRQGRRSLAGLGIGEAARVLEEDFTEEQRREFLGQSSELNEAFAALRATRGVAQERTASVSQARSLAGTEQGLVGQKREAFEGDVASVAARNQIAADVRLEIERERALALAEARRQATRAQQKADSYASGDSAMMVEGSGMVRAAVDTVTDTTDAMVADATGFDQYTAVANQAFAGARGSGMSEQDARKLEAIGAAAVMLGKQRRNAQPFEEVMLSTTDVQTILSTARGEFVEPSEITDRQRRDLTNQINNLASEQPATAGAGRGFLGGMMDMVGIPSMLIDTAVPENRRTPADLLSSVSGLSRESVDTAKQQLAVSSQQNALVEEQNALLREQNQLMGRTADNTKPATPNPGDVIRGAATQSDRRAPR